MINLILGDCLIKLKELKDNSVDSIVTDPPYGLKFMNKKWDYNLPSVEVWKECLRVLKPGGHLLSFGGSRTQHRLVCNIEDAGFEIRDTICWVNGSGFPKSLNIGKQIDKLQGNKREEIGTERCGKNCFMGGLNEKITSTGKVKITKGNSDWEGWGTGLKPAVELICVARKPLSEKTIVENVLKWGTGGINIDGCRIGIKGGVQKTIIEKNSRSHNGEGFGCNGKTEQLNKGRWPANIIFQCICDNLIEGKEITEDKTRIGGIWKTGGKETEMKTYKGTSNIHTNPNCPCYQLDEQSGKSKGFNRPNLRNSKYKNNFIDSDYKEIDFGKVNMYNDRGGASRFFYCPKASKKDRDEGLNEFKETVCIHTGKDKDGKMGLGGASLKGERKEVQPKKNNHPTVKPTKLMRYLVKLVTPKGGTVLDPFMGSGSTGKGCKLEGFNFIGIEIDKSYFDIAEQRINNIKSNPDTVKPETVTL